MIAMHAHSRLSIGELLFTWQLGVCNLIAHPCLRPPQTPSFELASKIC
jgi:hypothetical protein